MNGWDFRRKQRETLEFAATPVILMSAGAHLAIVRAELAGLRRELARARDELRTLRSAQVQEVDEQLVLAAVNADSAAQSAVTSYDELTRYSQLDELTGAPNRTLMLDRLHNAIALAQRRATRVGVLFVDLDQFKQINDTLGHAASDQVLQLVTQRLQGASRCNRLHRQPPQRRRVPGAAERHLERRRRRRRRPQDARLAGRFGANRAACAEALGQHRHRRLSRGRQRPGGPDQARFVASRRRRATS
jgi:GGDEF domain-containing protein